MMVETHFNVSISDLQIGMYIYEIMGENTIKTNDTKIYIIISFY